MNPKTAKFLTKTAFGLVVSTLIGYAIKAEHQVDERIDRHFDAKASESEND